MFLMYVDESGDCGILNSPTQYFVLSGLVVHELNWGDYAKQLIAFRKTLKNQYGLLIREEIHSAHMINRPGPLVHIKKSDRLAILRDFADLLASMNGLNLINIVIDKQGKSSDYPVFETAWKALIQRFENTMNAQNFRGPRNDVENGHLLPDHTDDKKLTGLLRKMFVYNPIPNQTQFGPGYRDKAIRLIVEDPSFKESSESLFIQAVDLSAYLLSQHLSPNTYMREKSGHNYFKRLEPILCKKACLKDPMGIVRI